jgi:hypothetical protein
MRREKTVMVASSSVRLVSMLEKQAPLPSDVVLVTSEADLQKRLQQVNPPVMFVESNFWHCITHCVLYDYSQSLPKCHFAVFNFGEQDVQQVGSRM